MIQLKVNGVSRQFDGDPQMPLLWYLRDLLQLTGTKFGCGMGLCGACTVHLNGTAARSCVTSLQDVLSTSGNELPSGGNPFPGTGREKAQRKPKSFF